MEEQMKEIKELRKKVAFWTEQKYYDNQAKINAAMGGGRHNAQNTRKIDAELEKAQSDLAALEVWYWEEADALNATEQAENAARAAELCKSALNN